MTRVILSECCTGPADPGAGHVPGKLYNIPSPHMYQATILIYPLICTGIKIEPSVFNPLWLAGERNKKMVI